MHKKIRSERETKTKYHLLKKGKKKCVPVRFYGSLYTHTHLSYKQNTRTKADQIDSLKIKKEEKQKILLAKLTLIDT